MRLAIVAASSYEENGQVAPIPNAELDVELFGGRLAEPDAGFVVHAFSARRGLGEGIEELVADLGEKPSSLVFYFWGYALISEERGPTLLLDGPKLSSFSLARLRRQLSELSQVALVVLDTTLAAGSFGSPLDAVRAMGAALSGGESNLSSLIAVRAPERLVDRGPPPFTGLLQMILDAQTGSPVALTPESLFRAMQSEEVMFADIPSAGCFLGRREFVLVPAAIRSVAPPPVTSRDSTPEPVALNEVVPGTSDYDDSDEVTAPRTTSTEKSSEVVASVRAALPRPPPPPPPPLPRPVLEETPSPVPEPRRTLPSEPLLPASTEALYFRALLKDFERAGDADGAYRAALCLEALSEADLNESLLATTHRPDGLQPVRGALSYADWNERLCSGCDEPHTRAMLRALGPALSRLGHQHARRMRRESVLPEDARQDPEKSTTTLAKTLHWTSRLLCVDVAALYVLPEAPAGVSWVPGSESPQLTCGRALGSGFSLPELVCLWARELSFGRVEQSALCYFTDVAELSQLLLAALAVSGVTSLRSLDADAKRLVSGLKREVRGAAQGALLAAAQQFPPGRVSTLAEAFVRGAEFTARRAALVACGNLELTLEQDLRFARPGLTNVHERRADLLRFTVSPELGQIRAALGTAIR